MRFYFNVSQNFSFKLFKCIGIRSQFNFLDGNNILFVFTNIYIASTTTSNHLLEKYLIGIYDDFLVLGDGLN